MPRQVINIGIVANDGTGDSIRIAGQKINNNFEELYAETAVDSYISFDGNNIISNASNADINIVPAGTGTVVFPAVTFDDNEIRATRSNDNLVFSTQGAGGTQLESILFADNEISTVQSNADINFIPSGTGTVTTPALKISSNIAIKDNEIATTQSNSDLVLKPAGTGAIKINSVSLRQNTIATNSSNANLEFEPNGSGNVTINGFTMPSTPTGTLNFQTNASKVLSFVTPTYSISHGLLTDGTASIIDSTITAIDSFSATTYRTAKYFLSMTDSANSRYEFITANVVHDGTTAYVSSQGSVSNYGSSLVTLSADISGGNVRLLGQLSGVGDALEFRFQKWLINI
jgi:hypothetical protein